MTWYIVTDSDWNWDSDEGGSVPITVVEADGPEKAAEAALRRWLSKDPNSFDGAHLKVGRIELVGFAEADVDPVTRELKMGGYQPLADPAMPPDSPVDPAYEAELLRQGFVAVPVDLVIEIAGDLEAEINARYPEYLLKYPHNERGYQNDMEPVRRARAMIAAATANPEDGQ